MEHHWTSAPDWSLGTARLPQWHRTSEPCVLCGRPGTSERPNVYTTITVYCDEGPEDLLASPAFCPDCLSLAAAYARDRQMAGASLYYTQHGPAYTG